jgi:hypothetical protein
MFVTTVLVAVQMYYIKAWPAVVSIAFFITFGFFDGNPVTCSSLRLVLNRTLQVSSGERRSRRFPKVPGLL